MKGCEERRPPRMENSESWQKVRNKRMRRVLVIEDGPFLQRALKDFLLASGYAPHVVSSRAESLDIIHDLEFWGVIMDYIDPGSVSAKDFIRLLKLSAKNRDTPVAVITGLPYLPEDLDVVTVVTKPFDLGEVIRLLDRAHR